MKSIRLITAAFGSGAKELSIKTSLNYKDYIIDQVFYNDFNTKSRIHSLHPRLKGKIPKMMEWFEYPDYDYYIWVDSSFTIFDGFLENMFAFEDDNTDLFLFIHGKRPTLKAEFDYLSTRMAAGSFYLNSRYEGERMEEQVNKYLRDPGFVDDRLFSGGCFMYSTRLVEDKNNNFMKDWFLHNVLYSIQDQLSLPYLIHQHNVRYKVYPYDMMDSDFLKHDHTIFMKR